MKRALLIAYFFPPQVNSGTQRPLKFANHLAACGWQPVVLTVDDPPDARLDPALADELHHDVPVARVPFNSRVTASRLARFAGPWAGRVREGLEWRLRARHTFPDGYAGWCAGAVRAACRLHAAEPFDVIVATGYPWSSFDVARQASAATGVPWVADFRDPWLDDDTFAESASVATHVPPDAERLRRIAEAERVVLRRAAHVTAVTPRLAAYLRERGGEGAAPVTAIPNGWDAEDFARAVPRASDAQGRVRVVYTGVWGATYNPQRLYDAVARLTQRAPDLAARLQVVTAGFAPGRAAAAGIGASVEDLGRLPHAEAIGLMRSADALFLSVGPGLHASVQVPGKLYEYLAAGRPVIAEAGPGAVADLLQATGGGVLSAPGDTAALATLLERAALDGTAHWPRASSDAVASYERRALTAALAEVLQQAAARRPIRAR